MTAILFMIWQLRTGFLILCIIGYGTLNAQTIKSSDTIKPSTKNIKPLPIKPKKPKPITKEFSVGLKLNTDGWSVFAEKGWVKTEDSRNADKFYNVRVVQIEFGEHKHAKEIKQTNSNIIVNDKPKPYIYGKVNNFYTLKLGYGNRKMIAGKPEQGTISIHWIYAGGISIGLLKPYYLDAYVQQERKDIKYEDATREAFLNSQAIIGNAGWSKGLDEIKFVPGIQARTGLHFDFAASAKTKMGLEAGLSAELYTQKIEIMAAQQSFPYLFNAYISLQFGKRY